MTRKILVPFIMVILAVFLPTVCFATDGPTVSLGVVVANDGTADVPLVLSNNTGFGSLGIQISYDSEALELKSVDVVPTGDICCSKTVDINPYVFIWVSVSNVSYNGTLAILHFEIKDTTKSIQNITVSYDTGRDGDNRDGIDVNIDNMGQSIGLNYVAGAVIIGYGTDLVLYKADYDTYGKMLSLEALPLDQLYAETQSSSKLFLVNKNNYQPILCR